MNPVFQTRPLTKALGFALYAFSFLKHPIPDPVRIYIQGRENGLTLATGCFKVTTLLPSWYGGWFFTSHFPAHQRYEGFSTAVLYV